MKVLIIGTVDAISYRLLNKKLNQLIEKSQCFLFYVLCGYIGQNKSDKTELGELWAKKNGAPVLYTSAFSEEKLMHRLLFKADYAIFILDGTSLINNIFMQYKMMGKHGSAIKRK